MSLNAEYVKSVRTRPGMYFGNTEDGSAEVHIVHELISNVLDLHLSGLATRVDVVLDGDVIEVSDDGCGFPFEYPYEEDTLATHMMMVPHFTPAAYEKAPHIHLHQLHGVGLAAVLAVSRSVECWSWRHGQLWYQAFSRGEMLGKARVVDKGDLEGTRIRVCIDEEIFSVGLDVARLREILRDATHLYPGFMARLNGEEFCAPRGLLDRALEVAQMTDSEQARWGERPGLVIAHRGEHFGVHAAVWGYAEQTRWGSWLNGVPSRDHGVHKEGFERVLGEFGWSPGVAMLNVTAQSARYARPTKDEVAFIASWEHIEACLRSAVRAYCRIHEP